uniref:V-type proton ATPase 21 kDa proteolipid subunit n=1 Tax=Sus scrofa TaxID=9823 RepID=A0A481CU22_PIG
MADGLGVSSTERLSHVADDNCHDDAVDGHSLTEDDADQVLGLDPGGLHPSPNDGRASNINAPGGWIRNQCAKPERVIAPKMTKNPMTPPAMIQPLPSSHSSNTHHAAPTTDREIARPMPRFDHMKGEVSVKNHATSKRKPKSKMV